MDSNKANKCPVSLKSLAGTDPYPLYETMRSHGEVLFDEESKAWLVTSAAGCRALMRTDVESLRFWTTALGDAADDIQGNRSLKLLTGERHQRLHTWWLKQFGAKELDVFRESGVRPVVNRLIDRFVEDGRVEFVTQYSNLLPIRAVAIVLDLPWQDDEWIERVYKMMKPIETFFNYSMVGDEAIINAARRATKDLEALLLPFVEERRSGEGIDMISRLWKHGPNLLEDWTVADVQTNARHLLFAGSETTTHALSSAIYLLMTQPGLAERIRSGGTTAVRNFVEEVLRLFGPVQYRARLTNHEIEVAGVKIAKDQFVVSMQAAANRDPEKYKNPLEIDLDRPAPRDHIAFNFGPRTCIGAGLARMEIQETVAVFLERLPDIKLDPDAEQPRVQGIQLRDFRPLHAIFAPGKKMAS